MTRPRTIGFRERLAEALAVARARGRLTERAYESLLLDPGFEEAEFEGFRLAAAGSGVDLPETDADPRDGDPRPTATEPERNLLEIYLDEIGRQPLLAHPELLEMAHRARHGDERARRQMILSNLRLVVHLARGYRHRGLPMLDLIEEGNLGLIHAVDRFDPGRGVRFSTYAAIWIRQHILKGIAEQARSVRIPVQMFQQMNRYVRIERALRARLGREPTPAEVARELDVSTTRAERLASLVAGLRSLDEGSANDALERLSAEDLGEAPMSVERLVELQLEHQRVDRLLRSLGRREEQILRLRYGFPDGVARTLAQTGEHFGITRERVRQIEARALERLRHALELEQKETAVGTRLQ